MKNKLSQVVRVEKDNCVNCHSCISACPVKYCNNASGDHVSINADMCIGCGACIKNCTHDARIGVDDFESFINDVRNNKFIAVLAPAAASNFDNILKLNGFLTSFGVDAFFDVSFGAELTIKSYLDYITAHSPQTVISQPCPAIVTYIEIYHLNLSLISLPPIRPCCIRLK